MRSSNIQPTGHQPDCDAIAALAEGKLSAGAAGELKAHLASCEACYEVFVETVELLEEDEELPAEGIPAPGVLPFRRRWGSKAYPLAAAGLAAVLAASLVVVVGPWGGLVGAFPPGEELAAGLTGEWQAANWGALRGPSADTERAALWAGARHVELSIALRSESVPGVKGSLGALQALGASSRSGFLPTSRYSIILSDLEASGSLEGLAGQIEDSETLARLNLEARDLGATFRLGRWAAAGRVGAMLGEEGVLKSRAFRRLTAELAGSDLPTEQVARITKVQEILSGELGKGDLDQLRELFEEALGRRPSIDLE